MEEDEEEIVDADEPEESIHSAHDADDVPDAEEGMSEGFQSAHDDVPALADDDIDEENIDEEVL